MASAIKGGKARLEQIAQQKAGKIPAKDQVDTVKAASKKASAMKPVSKKKK